MPHNVLYLTPTEHDKLTAVAASEDSDTDAVLRIVAALLARNIPVKPAGYVLREMNAGESDEYIPQR